MVLRTCFGPNEEQEVTNNWGKSYKEDFHNLFSSPNIIRVIKSGQTRWAGQVAHTRERRNAYWTFVGIPGEMKPPGRCKSHVGGQY
jgi:hypothetical protein